MKDLPAITLASGSAIRAAILSNAGVNFTVQKPNVDESEIKKAAAAKMESLEDTAQRLADAKCLAVAVKTAGIVIGSDQILGFEGRAFDKPASLDEAKQRLRQMQGATHSLINAVALARDGDIIWRLVSRPTLRLRSLSDSDIDAYINEAGAEILASVGAYQVEGLGARLFEKIDGDYFAVLGLSLFPLLNELRRLGAIEY